MEAGVTEDQLPGAYAAVDKLEREGADRVAGRLTDRLGLTAETAAAVLDVFASRELGGVVDRYGHRPAVMERVDALREFVGALEAMGLGEFVEVDLTIVRGLAYYTGIVFELFDRKGEFRAICGGGRYDRLLELVGGDALPAVGFGMGDVVLGELLRERGLAPDYRRVVDTFVVVIGGEQRSVALEIAHRLRDSGEAVLYALRDASVRKQFQASGTEGARRVIVLGPDEVARGVAVERDMATGTEREVALEELT
jgi:histidyl-tRNA synthetase